MRIYLALIIFFAAAVAVYAETAEEFMKRGIDYYLRSDYPAAREMFGAITDAAAETMGVAAYYKGAIAAHDGDESAYDYFAQAIKSAPEEIKKAARLQLVKYAYANGNWKKIAEAVDACKASVSADSALAYYYAEALWNLEKKDVSKEVLSQMLASEFAKKDSLGADMFAESRALGEDFSKSIDLSKLDSSTPAAKARLEIIEGKKVAHPQSEISLYAQVISAENGDDFNAAILAETAKKFADSPYAWRAALAIARKNFYEKKYADATKFAAEAELLAPADMSVAWRVPMLQGDILRLEKKYDAACHAYLKIAMDKDSRGEPHAEALYKIGICYYEQGEWIKAHTYFQRVFVGYFKFEYWGALAYYYDARALYSMKFRRDANATLAEYFRRAKDRTSETYKEAKKFYDNN